MLARDLRIASLLKLVYLRTERCALPDLKRFIGRQMLAPPGDFRIPPGLLVRLGPRPLRRYLLP